MLKHVYRYMFIIIVVLLLVGTVAAQENVVVQFNWTHDSAWAGFYMAIDEGYYAENDLDVELRIVFE